MNDLIEIIIHNGIFTQINAIIIFEYNICYLNNKKYEVNDEFLEKIKNIILPWKREYGTSNIIDDEEFTVKIISNNEEIIYHGKGYYPFNYQELKDVIGELNGR